MADMPGTPSIFFPSPEPLAVYLSVTGG